MVMELRASSGFPVLLGNFISLVVIFILIFIPKGVNRVTPFTEKVIDIIRKIPQGRVMTYGQIARLAGSPRAARQVVRVLHSMSKNYKLPWHRVINAKGQIALQDEESYQEQKMNLEMEGVETRLNGTIDLPKYQWHPEQ
jgi:methylated-DNA-protein-cysteine methyltransferase related protein